MKSYFISSSKPSAIWLASLKLDERIDVNPYKIEHIENENILDSNIKIISISEGLRSQKDLTGGATPLGANYLKKGIKFIRTQNVQRNTIDLSDVVYISDADNEKLTRSKLEEDDILLTITGADFGRIAPVRKSHLPANINQHSVRLHFKDNINSYFISTYLNSKFGQSQIFKYSIGVTRPAIDYSAIRKIKIPIPSPEIQEYIGNKVRRAEELREEAKKLKEDIEEIFEEELELSKIREVKKDVEKQKNKWVRDEEIEERIDGEFYHPRYNFYDKALFNLDKIENHFKISKERINKNYVKEIRYIDLSSINNLISPQLMDIKDAPDRAKLKVKQGDVIISTLSGSKKIGIISYDLDGCICSTGFVVLRCTSSILTPEYLYAIFSNELFNVQIDKYSSGAIMSGVISSDFKKMLIPIIKNKLVVDKITNNIRNHFNKLSLSNSLIQEAKQDVEDLIEGNFDMSKLSVTTPESR